MRLLQSPGKLLLSAGTFIALLAISVTSTVQISEAATKVTRTMRNGGRIGVFADRCSLRVVASSTELIQRIQCRGRARGTRPPPRNNRVILRTGDSASIFARSCVIIRTSATKKRIDLRCLRPTPTPTPTATATSTPTVTPTVNASVLLSGDRLASFNTSFPAGADTPIAVTGLNVGDALVSIDRRPQNGMLYGLGYNGTAGTVQLYGISSETNVAVAIGTPSNHVDSDGVTVIRVGVDNSTQIGMDFNPTVDRIRVVTGNGQNFRMNPNTGGLVDGDQGGSGGSITGLNMDGNINSGTTTASDAAYVNSFPNASVTTQYMLDGASEKLCIQSPPNAGTQTGCVNVNPPITSASGLDIPRSVTVATSNTAVTSGEGFSFVRFVGGSSDVFASVNLTDGIISSLGQLGSETSGLLSFAISQTSNVDVVALTNSNSLVRFNSATPGTVTTVALSSVVSGETMVGIDWRPSTGQLFGLGYDATNGTGSASLYIIDPQTGACTLVGSAGAVADGSGSPISISGAAQFGFGFNPTVDRIRVVTDNGLNLRINPTSAAPLLDGNQTGGTTSATGAAYTNSFGGATVTTLYTLDGTTDSLFIQNPPNNGTQTSALPITLGGASLDFGSVMGFDIARDVRVTTSSTAVASGSAYAALTVGGNTGLYRIDLVTGAATLLGAIGTGSTPVAGIAVSQATVK